MPEAPYPPRPRGHQPCLRQGRAHPQRPQRCVPGAWRRLGRQRDPQLWRCRRPGPAGHRRRCRPRGRLRRRRHAARGRQRGRRGIGRDGAANADGHPARRHGQRLRPRDRHAQEAAGRDRVLCTSTRTRAIDVGRLRAPRPGAGRRPLLHPAAVHRRRARGADEPRAQGQVRRVRVPRSRHPAARRDEASSSTGWRSTARRPRVRGVQGLHGELGDDGLGLKIAHGYAIDDGLLDCFVLDKRDLHDAHRRGRRFLDLHTAAASRYYRQAAPSASRPSPTSPSGRTASTSVARRSRSTCSRVP